MPAKILSAALIGIDSSLVEIECDVALGLPKFIVVGLPDASVRESRERVTAAIKNSLFPFPSTKLTMNLAPADLKKEGPCYDLPMALSILCHLGEVKHETTRNALFIGELALDGDLRPIRGALSHAFLAKHLGFTRIFVPEENAPEAALVPGLEVFGPRSLRALVDHLRGDERILPFERKEDTCDDKAFPFDLAHIAGLEAAKRAMEIAAAGGHNILLSGSPGAGKTLLARALPSILPRMSRDEALEVTRIHSVARLLPPKDSLLAHRPCRAPHHSASGPAVIGGGSEPRPGEVTLAHRGVLFLDEFPEFPRPVLEALRQPLEDREVTISRASGSLRFPASFMLVAARNPCPCGYHGDPERPCSCSPQALQRYQKKISGPLLDRIDLYLEVPRISYEELSEAGSAEPSSSVRKRVETARRIQFDRLARFSVYTNAATPGRHLKMLCPLSEGGEKLLLEASKKFRLSPRAVHRAIKVARTIADLAGEEHVATAHVAEALRYRKKD